MGDYSVTRGTGARTLFYGVVFERATLTRALRVANVAADSDSNLAHKHDRAISI